MYEMKNVARIIEAHGGIEALKAQPIKIDDVPHHDRLCIEYVGESPWSSGAILVSVAHYFVQNGDLMSDPEMVFEVNPGDSDRFGWRSGTWQPVSITQSPVGVYREAIYTDQSTGRVMLRPALIRDLRQFSRMWNRNIGEQGYVESARRKGPYRPVTTPAPIPPTPAPIPAAMPDVEPYRLRNESSQRRLF